MHQEGGLKSGKVMGLLGVGDDLRNCNTRGSSQLVSPLLQEVCQKVVKFC